MRILRVTATTMVVAMTTAANAASMEAMQGAWTPDGIDCAKAFAWRDGKAEFREQTIMETPGIIVSGSRISSPQGTCTARQIKRSKGRISVQLDCANAVVFNEISVSFRIINHDRFERFDALFPKDTSGYHRCTP